MDNSDSKAKLEEQLYNSDEFAEKYDTHWLAYGHAQGPGFYAEHYRALIYDEITRHSKGRHVLELGATYWHSCLDFSSYPPAKVTCINISQRELDKGISLSRALFAERAESENLFEFRIMDAHHLELQDNTVDIVIGDGILHHLDFEAAILEIRRVLKPGGLCLFMEPLGSNPIGKLVRHLTPHVRTPGEKPLGKKELAAFNRCFDAKFCFSQLLYFPAGVISGKLMKTPFNKLMKAAYKTDCFLAGHSPLWFKRLFRIVHIIGEKSC